MTPVPGTFPLVMTTTEKGKDQHFDAPVVDPCTLLALFAAIFGATATAAFGKLSRELLPLATFIIGALSDASLRVIFPAQIPHDDARPVLHIFRMVPHSELFYQREDIEVVRLEIFLILFVFRLVIERRSRNRDNTIQSLQLTVDFEPWNKMSVLEVMAQITIFRNICEKLKGH
jgi:hypothetical protein